MAPAGSVIVTSWKSTPFAPALLGVGERQRVTEVVGNARKSAIRPVLESVRAAALIANRRKPPIRIVGFDLFGTPLSCTSSRSSCYRRRDR